jgi:CRP-like cAMP-binding protein
MSADKFDRIYIEIGDRLFRECEQGDCAFIVQSGSLKITKIGENEIQKLLRLLNQVRLLVKWHLLMISYGALLR